MTCINGGLAGMVSLCAGCNVLHQGAAFALGLLGGFTVWWVGNTVRAFRIDDPLDAFAVHYGGGVVGVLFTPVFMNDGIVHWTRCADQNLLEGEPCDYKPFQVWCWNLVGIIAITLWSGVLCGLMFFGLMSAGLLRSFFFAKFVI